MAQKTKEQISFNMRRVRGKGSELENAIRAELDRRGLTAYSQNDKTVFGKPDFAFKARKVAVFCDSEFWHGYDWGHANSEIKSNREFWIPKIEKNIARDKVVTKSLKSDGWTVLRFWGKRIEKNASKCCDKIEQALRVYPSAPYRKTVPELSYSIVLSLFTSQIYLNICSELTKTALTLPIFRLITRLFQTMKTLFQRILSKPLTILREKVVNLSKRLTILREKVANLSKRLTILSKRLTILREKVVNRYSDQQFWSKRLTILSKHLTILSHVLIKSPEKVAIDPQIDADVRRLLQEISRRDAEIAENF